MVFIVYVRSIPGHRYSGRYHRCQVCVHYMVSGVHCICTVYTGSQIQWTISPLSSLCSLHGEWCSLYMYGLYRVTDTVGRYHRCQVCVHYMVSGVHCICTVYTGSQIQWTISPLSSLCSLHGEWCSLYMYGLYRVTDTVIFPVPNGCFV